jgi:hypothetical protein
MASKKSIHEILHSAYSFVRSVEANRSVAAITLDHLLQEQIDAIKGGESLALLDAKGENKGMRAAKLEQLDSLERDIDAVVQAVESAGEDPEKLVQLGLRVIPLGSI